jgi:putative membrane protein
MDFTWVLPLADSWDMHGDFDSGWWIVMMVAMVLFWGAIILGIVWLIRGGFERSQGERRETPIEILERRFAEGAISVEDYHHRREVILSGARRGQGAGGEG